MNLGLIKIFVFGFLKGWFVLWPSKSFGRNLLHKQCWQELFCYSNSVSILYRYAIS